MDNKDKDEALKPQMEADADAADEMDAKSVIDTDVIEEAIKLEDAEDGYDSSAQAKEEDALLAEFGF